MTKNLSRRKLLGGCAGLCVSGTALQMFSQTSPTKPKPKPGPKGPPPPQPRDPIADKVKNIIARELQVEERKLLPNTRFIEDLGADSLDRVELVMDLEEAFDIEIPDGDAQKFTTVQRVIDYIKQRKQAQKSKPATAPPKK